MNAKIDISQGVLLTDRLILRPFEYKDLNDLYSYASVDGVGGSAKFEEDFIIEETKYRKHGYIVFKPLFGDSNIECSDIGILKEMHKRKIDLSNEILVISKSGYIGDSTKCEI